MTKEEIRFMIRREKRALFPEMREKAQKEIKKMVINLPSFLIAKEIFTYVSYNQEVDTFSIITEALKQNKKVAVPKVDGKDIAFYYISSLSDLAPGYQQILEPTTAKLAYPSDEICMIMPGLAFDFNGNRLGYGGGFYDRYMERFEDIPYQKIALAYDFQLMDAIPTQLFDQRIDQIVTPTRHITCSR